MQPDAEAQSNEGMRPGSAYLCKQLRTQAVILKVGEDEKRF